MLIQSYYLKITFTLDAPKMAIYVDNDKAGSHES